MKNYPVCLLALALLIGLGGCSKKNISSPLPSYDMSATLTKPTMVTLFSASGHSYVTAIDSNNECIISGTETSGAFPTTNFTITIYYYAGVGTYSLDSMYAPVSEACYETINPAFTQTAFASGSVVITKISGDNVYGSFSGNLTDGTVVTNGKFIALGTGF